MRITRFSGADWGDQLHPIMLIGAGGIGSWTALNLSRIGHELYIIDPDQVDETNVTGGQMYRQSDVGKTKVSAVLEVCRSMGCVNTINTISDYFTEETGMTPICITGLDNMAARKLVFEEWLKNISQLEDKSGCILIDGRLTLEMFEIFTIQGNKPEQIAEYAERHLFSDEEAQELDCTTKQSTFGAMGISSFITATLCNWLTNQKLGAEFRDVPFYQRVYFPMFENKQEAIVTINT